MPYKIKPPALDLNDRGRGLEISDVMSVSEMRILGFDPGKAHLVRHAAGPETRIFGSGQGRTRG
jgi:hypothetical protein